MLSYSILYLMTAYRQCILGSLDPRLPPPISNTKFKQTLYENKEEEGGVRVHVGLVVFHAIIVILHCAVWFCISG